MKKIYYTIGISVLLLWTVALASSWLWFGRLPIRELLLTTNSITKFNTKWIEYRITTSMISSPADDTAVKNNLSVSARNNCYLDDFTVSEYDTNVKNSATNPLLKVMTDGRFFVVCPKF